MNINRKNVVSSVALVAVGVLGFWLFYFNTGESELTVVSEEQYQDETAIENSNDVPEEIQDSVVESSSTLLPLTYKNLQFEFQMDIPLGYTGSSFVEGAGVTVLIQNTDVTNESFQIYIAPFDEEGELSPERIKQDLPGLVITEPQIAIVGGGEKDALIFIGESEEFGKTREVWFVHNGNLYQVIAPLTMEGIVGPIMETLHFNQ